MALIGLFLIFTIITARVGLRTGSAYSHAAIAFALAVVARVVMFPNSEDRFLRRVLCDERDLFRGGLASLSPTATLSSPRDRLAQVHDTTSIFTPFFRTTGGHVSAAHGAYLIGDTRKWML